jgi:hypothetical protein
MASVYEVFAASYILIHHAIIYDRNSPNHGRQITGTRFEWAPKS